VGPADLALLVNVFGSTTYDSNPADLNNWAHGNVDYDTTGAAGLVGPNDLAQLLANWGLTFPM
jgi:hypothetical protein